MNRLKKEPPGGIQPLGESRCSFSLCFYYRRAGAKFPAFFGEDARQPGPARGAVSSFADGAF